MTYSVVNDQTAPIGAGSTFFISISNKSVNVRQLFTSSTRLQRAAFLDAFCRRFKD